MGEWCGSAFVDLKKTCYATTPEYVTMATSGICTFTPLLENESISVQVNV